MTPHNHALFDREEFNRWFHQAEHTIGSAQRDQGAGDYAWSCFKAQQAGEYALKALLRGLGKPASGHSLLKLVEEVKKAGISIPRQLPGWARELDRHYIPPRYPDAYAAGSPFEFYDQDTAERALQAAAQIIDLVKEVGSRAESP